MNTDETQTECGQTQPFGSLNRSRQIDAALEARLLQLNQDLSAVAHLLDTSGFRQQLSTLGSVIRQGVACKQAHPMTFHLLLSFQDDLAKLIQKCQAVNIALDWVQYEYRQICSDQQRQP